MKPATAVESINYSFVPNHRITMEALAQSRLSAREFRCVILIMNQTDGYLRPEDTIQPAFFLERTAIGSGHLSHALSRLIQWKVVSCQGRSYKVNPPNLWAPHVTLANLGETQSCPKAKPRSPQTAGSPKRASLLAQTGEFQSCTKENLKKGTLRGAERPNKAETTELGVLPTPEARREYVAAAESKPRALYSALVTLFPGGGFPAPGGGARCPAIGRLGAMEKAHGWGQVLEQMEHARIDQAVGKVSQGDVLSWIERRLQGGIRSRAIGRRAGAAFIAPDPSLNPDDYRVSAWPTAITG